MWVKGRDGRGRPVGVCVHGGRVRAVAEGGGAGDGAMMMINVLTVFCDAGGETAFCVLP